MIFTLILLILVAIGGDSKWKPKWWMYLLCLVMNVLVWWLLWKWSAKFRGKVNVWLDRFNQVNGHRRNSPRQVWGSPSTPTDDVGLATGLANASLIAVVGNGWVSERKRSLRRSDGTAKPLTPSISRSRLE